MIAGTTLWCIGRTTTNGNDIYPKENLVSGGLNLPVKLIEC